jgi:hypothetical protein
MESEVSEILKANKAYEADLLAGRTYRWLAMFLISGILLATCGFTSFTRYVRKSDAYQVALQDPGTRPKTWQERRSSSWPT